MLLSKAGLCKTERRLCLTFTVEADDVRQAASGWNRLKRTYLSGSKGLEPRLTAWTVMNGFAAPPVPAFR